MRERKCSSYKTENALHFCSPTLSCSDKPEISHCQQVHSHHADLIHITSFLQPQTAMENPAPTLSHTRDLTMDNHEQQDSCYSRQPKTLDDIDRIVIQPTIMEEEDEEEEGLILSNDELAGTQGFSESATTPVPSSTDDSVAPLSRPNAEPDVLPSPEDMELQVPDITLDDVKSLEDVDLGEAADVSDSAQFPTKPAPLTAWAAMCSSAGQNSPPPRPDPLVYLTQSGEFNPKRKIIHPLLKQRPTPEYQISPLELSPKSKLPYPDTPIHGSATVIETPAPAQSQLPYPESPIMRPPSRMGYAADSSPKDSISSAESEGSVRASPQTPYSEPSTASASPKSSPVEYREPTEIEMIAAEADWIAAGVRPQNMRCRTIPDAPETELGQAQHDNALLREEVGTLWTELQATSNLSKQYKYEREQERVKLRYAMAAIGQYEMAAREASGAAKSATTVALDMLHAARTPYAAVPTLQKGKPGRWIRGSWLADLTPELAEAETLFAAGQDQAALITLAILVAVSRAAVDRRLALEIKLLKAAILGASKDVLHALANAEFVVATAHALGYQPIAARAQYQRARFLLHLGRWAEASFCFVLSRGAEGHAEECEANLEYAEVMRTGMPPGHPARYIPKTFSAVAPDPAKHLLRK